MNRYMDKQQSKHHKENLSELGYTIIKQLHTIDKINQIKSLLIKYHDPAKIWSGVPARDSDDKRIYNLAQKDYQFIQFITNQNLLEILKPGLQDPYYRLIDDSYCNFILNSFSARSSGQFLDLHIDSVIPFKGDHPLGYVAINAIEKTTEKNGATFLIPKSHQSGSYSDRSRKDYVCAELDPGDVLVIDSRTWHGAHKNQTSESRWTVNAHFTRWFIKQDINIPDSLSSNIYSMCSVQQKILLGLCSIPSPSEDVRINIKCGLDILNDKFNNYS